MRPIVFAILLVLAGQPVLADPIALLAVQPGLLCQQAIETAGRAHATPPGLMAAIGRVESGRHDPVSGALHPWPWTVDAEGQGMFYDSKAQAIAAVRALQARGVASIDVGCMQVNLMHHPDAFNSLEQAFDPMANADYAGRFLVELHGQTGAWPAATALYHSATPELGAAYRAEGDDGLAGSAASGRGGAADRSGAGVGGDAQSGLVPAAAEAQRRGADPAADGAAGRRAAAAGPRIGRLPGRADPAGLAPAGHVIPAARTIDSPVAPLLPSGSWPPVMAGEGRPPTTLLRGIKKRRGWAAFAGHDTGGGARHGVSLFRAPGIRDDPGIGLSPRPSQVC